MRGITPDESAQRNESQEVVALTTASIQSVLCKFLVIAFCVALAGVTETGLPAQPASKPSEPLISVRANQQVFDTMCALDAAGFDIDESTFGQMPAQIALHTDLLKMQGPATDALRKFYRQHTFASRAETLSPYITFALLAGPPPQFKLPGDRNLLPPDVLTINGFQRVLSNFYREANLGARWAKIEPEYQPELRRYRFVLSQIVTVCNAYLREIVKPVPGYTFTVYVEPFVGTLTNFRNYGDHYSLVVGPANYAPVNLMQHAYLHFVLDPLVLRYQSVVEKKAALLDVAARAPRLPVEYQNDFVALMDECLIRAVQLRLQNPPPAQREAALRQADESGFILVRPLVAQLRKFEKTQPAMSYYFPQLISGIDVQAQEQRLQNFSFAPGSPIPPEEPSISQSEKASGIGRLLAEGGREIADQNAAGATQIFDKVLASHPDNSQALYGLAIASVLQGKAEQARKLFEEVVSLSKTASSKSGTPVDPNILSWSHVYLGRIHDLEDERDPAISEYRAALAVTGAPADARLAAENGIAKAYKPVIHANNRQQQH